MYPLRQLVHVARKPISRPPVLVLLAVLVSFLTGPQELKRRVTPLSSFLQNRPGMSAMTSLASTGDLPHSNSLQLTRGKPPSPSTKAALVLVHGRGASAEDMMTGFGPLLDSDGIRGEDVYAIAIEAQGRTWYPHKWDHEPQEEQEPYLTGALTRIDRTISSIQSAGVPSSRIILVGFSQGACLSLTYLLACAVRASSSPPERLASVFALSGTNFRSVPSLPPKDRPSLSGNASDLPPLTPVWLLSGVADTFFSPEQVRSSARRVEQTLGEEAEVTCEILPAHGHWVNEYERGIVVRKIRDLCAK